MLSVPAARANRCATCWPCAAFVAACIAIFLLADSRDQPAGPPVPTIVQRILRSASDCEPARPCTAVIRRSKARARIAWQVIEGRLTLLQAAEHYRDLDEICADYDWNTFRHCFRDCASDEERHARHVLAAISATLLEEPERRRIIVTRLETARRDTLSQGTFRLPEE